MVIYPKLAPGGMGRRGLGRDKKKPTEDSFRIFEDMPVSLATEKLIVNLNCACGMSSRI